MIYHTFEPHPDLASIVKFYWTLEVPFDPANEKQKIVPDGCVEMTFNFGDEIKRFTSETAFVLHPNAMVMGQRTESFDILPVGDVDTFAICFYPLGFANFVSTPLDKLVNKEIPLTKLFDEAEAKLLEEGMMSASSSQERIKNIESFLLNKLKEKHTISAIVQSTVDTLLASKGTTTIGALLKDDLSKRRQLERHFKRQIGISPKQLSKAIRLQTTLNLMLNQQGGTLTEIAYESEYFDQNHFIKDFKEFLGVTPKEFLNHKNLALSALFYK